MECLLGGRRTSRRATGSTTSSSYESNSTSVARCTAVSSVITFVGDLVGDVSPTSFDADASGVTIAPVMYNNLRGSRD